MKEKKGKIKTRFYKSKKFIFVVIVLLLIITIFGSRFLSSRRKNGESSSVEIKKGSVREELILSGEVNADEYAKMSFGSSGKISWVGVREGQEIKKGQALAKLDTTSLNAAFQQARATLRAAEATVANVHDQVKDHSGDETYAQKDTRTTAEVAKDKAYEAYIAAEDALKNATLFAPFNGIVTYIAKPYSGVNILFSESMLEIINPKTIYFDVLADQSEVINLKLGQKTEVTLDSYENESFEGEIVFISFVPKTGETGATYKVKVMIKNSDLSFAKFRIGMTGDAKFVLREKNDVLYIPPRYIKSDKEGKYVSLRKKNNKVNVEVGMEGEDRVEIKGDIKEGDIVYD